jgi:hypothetical protein
MSNGNPNLNRILKQAIYQLRNEYGAPVQVYKIDSAATDYKTGVKTATKSVIDVRKAVVGQGWDGTSRAFIFLGSDLPGYEWEVEDWIVYRSRKYEVTDIEALEFDTGWMIIGKEAKGNAPERIINLNVVSSFNPEDTETDVVE